MFASTVGAVLLEIFRFKFVLFIYTGVLKDVQALDFCSQYALKTLELNRANRYFLLFFFFAVILSKIQKQLRSKSSVELLLLCQRQQEAENKLIFSLNFLFNIMYFVTSLKLAKLLSKVSNFNLLVGIISCSQSLPTKAK